MSSPLRILIAGGTGVIGRELVPRLVALGHEVHGIARGDASRRSLEAMGAHAHAADVFDPDALARAFDAARPEVVIHQLTALPARIDPNELERDIGPTNRLRTAGTRNLIAACARTGTRRFITQSIAFWAAPGEGLASEDDPLYLDAPAGGFRAMIDAAATMERLVAAGPATPPGAPAPADWIGTSLRYGQFYGPGTIFDDGGSFIAGLARRRIPVVGNGAGVFSLIHVADAALATIAALDRPTRGAFHIVDDTPVAAAELIPELARLIGAKPPRRVPAWLARPLAGAYGIHMMTRMRGASNARAKAALGWRPLLPDWRHGMHRHRTSSPG